MIWFRRFVSSRTDASYCELRIKYSFSGICTGTSKNNIEIVLEKMNDKVCVRVCVVCAQKISHLSVFYSFFCFGIVDA